MRNPNNHPSNSFLAIVLLLCVFSIMEVMAQSPTHTPNAKKSLKKVEQSSEIKVLINPSFLENRTKSKSQVLVQKDLQFKPIRFLSSEAKKQVAELEEMNKTLQINYSNKNNTPFFISGKNLYPANLQKSDAHTQVNAAFAFMNTYKDLLQLKQPISEFEVKNVESDVYGKTHIRLAQHFQGLLVWGSDVIVHLNEEGVEGFNGRYEATPTLEVLNASISETRALELVEKDLRTFTVIEELSESAKKMIHHEDKLIELVIYPHEEQHLLAWQVVYFASLADRWEYFVEAQTGKILHKFQHICKDGPTTASAKDLKGITRQLNTYQIGNDYVMLDAQRPMFNAAQSKIPDDPVGGILTLDLDNRPLSQINSQLSHVSSSNNNWDSNPTAVSAHHNAALCYEYFEGTHGRNSLNGQGGTIYSVINIAESDGGGMDNAFWNGHFMGYGSGRTAFNAPLAKSLDVAGHEMTHGVIQNTANLVYRYQSGALNESFADVFGVLIDRDDWTLGEDIVNTSVFPSGALRSMSNPNNGSNSPTSSSWQPKHMSEYINTSKDNGGVHINSGIPNKAFYNYATQVGKDKAEKVYYRALSNYLTQSSQFIDARLAIVKSAQDIYGTNAPEVSAARTAFNQVGILNANEDTGGGEEEIEDYENDLPPVEGENHMVVMDASNTDPNAIYDILLTPSNELQSFNDLTTDALPAVRKPSVTEDGLIAYFVSNDNNIYAIGLNGSSAAFQVSAEPLWDNVAISPDGRKLALVSKNIDRSIYVFDFDSETSEQYILSNPSTAEGVSGGEPRYADIIEWDPTGQYILYDAENRLTSNFGEPTDYWDIGILKAWDNAKNTFDEEGFIFKLFPSLPDGIQVGNPTYAKNSPHIISFDYINTFNGEITLVAANTETGKTVDIFVNSILNFPSYSPNDNAVAFTALDQGDTILAVIPLANDKITPSDNGYILAREAKFPTWYAKGSRSYQSPQADFTANITESEVPITVNFFDRSTNIPTAWTWTFEGGNPSTSNLQNPIVTYEQQGMYDVSLSITNPAGNDTETKNGYLSLFATGIEENATSLQRVLIFPNPSEGNYQVQLELASSEKVRMVVSNVLGQIVWEQQLEEVTYLQEKLDLTEFPIGQYALTLQIGGVQQSYQLVKLK